MQVTENVPLKDYSTMRLGGPARYLTHADTREQLAEAVQWAGSQQLPLLVLGGGSNVIVRDEGFPGLVIINRIMGFDTISDDPSGTTLKVGAGENWDQTVNRTVQMGLSGIEFLSLIPGTVGGTPVQNVGAYGSEVAETMTELEAYDTNVHQFVTLQNEDCQFTYRNSIFKSPKNRHYIIVSVTFHLSKNPPTPPFYEKLQKYLDEHNTTLYTPEIIREAVIAIRTASLPDPDVYPNTGSFFKNPVVERYILEDIQKDYPDVPFFEMADNKVKIPAGWLIDQAGMKNYAAHGMTTYEKNALVFVNESAQAYVDLYSFREEIKHKIHEVFNIWLEQEPETI